jgi:hypothetical protein
MKTSYYIDDKRIQKDIFNDEPTPGPNTLGKSQLDSYKLTVTRKIQIFCSRPTSATLFTDTYGVLEEISLRLFRQLVEEGTCDLLDNEKRDLIKAGYVAPAAINKLLNNKANC